MPALHRQLELGSLQPVQPAIAGEALVVERAEPSSKALPRPDQDGYLLGQDSPLVGGRLRGQLAPEGVSLHLQSHGEEDQDRRYYAITETGATEYEQLLEEVLPFLGALARSLDGIFGEIYGEG